MKQEQTSSNFSINFYDGYTETGTAINQTFHHSDITWGELLGQFIRFLEGAGYIPDKLKEFHNELAFEDDLPTEEE